MIYIYMYVISYNIYIYIYARVYGLWFIVIHSSIRIHIMAVRIPVNGWMTILYGKPTHVLTDRTIVV